MELIERYTVSTDWMTLTLLVGLLILAVAKFFYPEKFENFMRLFYTNRYFRLNQKALSATDGFSAMLFVVNILSASLFIFIALESFSLLSAANPKTLFFQIMLGYSLFFIIKYLLEKIVADIFGIEAVINPYLFYKTTYRNFLALLILPLDILLIYAFSPSQSFIVAILCVIGLINVVLLVDLYRKKRNYILYNWFYFILYLCAFEIAPYFILYKVITTT